MHSSRRGAAAITVVVVLIVVNLVIVGMVLSGARGHDMTVRRMETLQAFYAAEAGMNMAFRELMVDLDQDGDCSVGTISHDDDTGTDPAVGNARFVVTTNLSGTEMTVNSYGRCGDSRRNMSAVVDLSASQIVHDSSTPGFVSDDTQLTFSHTISGDSDRLLVVCVAIEANAGDYDIDIVRYDGVDMTPGPEHAVGSSLYMNVEIWYMLEADLPAAGTHSVYISKPGASADINAAAISVSGVAQQGPGSMTDSNDDNENGDSSIQASVTTTTDGCWLFECVGSGNAITGFTPDTGQDERVDQIAASARMAAGTKEVPSTGLENEQWTAESTSNRMSIVIAGFAPK